MFLYNKIHKLSTYIHTYTVKITNNAYEYVIDIIVINSIVYQHWLSIDRHDSTSRFEITKMEAEKIAPRFKKFLQLSTQNNPNRSLNDRVEPNSCHVTLNFQSH